MESAMHFRHCYTIILVLLLSAFLPACQSPPPEEEPEHRIADFYVRYLETERQIKAFAGFYEGDSIAGGRPLSVSGGVDFQELDMEKRTLVDRGIRYTVTRTANYPEHFSFTYRLGDEEQQHRFAMAPLNNFFFEGPVSISRGAKLVIEGEPLQSEESLILLFTDEENKTSKVRVSGPSPDNTFRLSPEQLAAIPPGPSLLYLVKKRSLIEEQPYRTVISAAEYYTKTLSLEIMP